MIVAKSIPSLALRLAFVGVLLILLLHLMIVTKSIPSLALHFTFVDVLLFPFLGILSFSTLGLMVGP
jgi:hypothetical protein